MPCSRCIKLICREDWTTFLIRVCDLRIKYTIRAISNPSLTESRMCSLEGVGKPKVDIFLFSLLCEAGKACNKAFLSRWAGAWSESRLSPSWQKCQYYTRMMKEITPKCMEYILVKDIRTYSRQKSHIFSWVILMLMLLWETLKVRVKEQHCRISPLIPIYSFKLSDALVPYVHHYSAPCGDSLRLCTSVCASVPLSIKWG